ncbi:glycosyltransferase family 2 protein [Ruegeria sp. Ofav3-42]|uniref:glycosyltransferase family 2 protein n=1 Tax=Ruegeria sp. Ofav3-42 TaxID=2917759 RepID=UPI001EF40039|nr:glycosyltransferase family 2 protein [Ruegeria sp. Ofav3-42]MCG7522004.1 glycosyltransferase family 2 protein [Ruegeria sp. Ofav3-42]
MSYSEPSLYRFPASVPATVSRPELSFVIPAFNEEDNIRKTLLEVAAEAKRLNKTFEIVVVDDGSTDKTYEQVARMTGELPLFAIRLSRNFGKEQAMSAGLARTRGNAVVILDADLQEPISTLQQLIERFEEGYDVVYAVRAHRNDESPLKRVLATGFYRLLSMGSECPIPPDARDYRIMDRKVVDALLSLPERNKFMKGLFSWVGFKTGAVPIELRTRHAGTSKFGARKLFGLALTGLTSFSDWPLRIWTVIGFAFASLSMLMSFWIVLKTMIWGVDVPGFATTTTAIFFLGGLQLMSIGVIGEYLSRVYSEVKQRPGFIIAEEQDANSAV